MVEVPVPNVVDHVTDSESYMNHLFTYLLYNLVTDLLPRVPFQITLIAISYFFSLTRK